jgi:hypothetical protein
MEEIRYSRAFGLCTDAIRTLACDRGDLRSRLLLIDTEFFLLPLMDIPDYDGLRNDFERLRESVTKFKSEGLAGNLYATIGRVQFKTLEQIAKTIWDIYGKFLDFRKSK